ncbi:MAG TPA: hypothetical protein DIW51_15845 [Rhodospirillaceae bacterium]|nr:hypothetical protein [Magnetovibrio sp.]HBT41111.1 hypothetical protein [Rhodospirillaceae bacterium]HCS71436.1 hypothetical protein [Rhodospirillaceae bacterium]|tara:strand:+ start:3105 stop:3962 length:858 start_codon:yes stop_codon:yes gene_type:complete
MTLCQDPFQGFGLGLRPQHFPDILGPDGDEDLGRVDWFEIISENFMAVGGMPLRNLMAVRERRPMAMHGVSLSIGAPDPLDDDYLKKLKSLADLIDPAVVSDHLCWTGAHGVNLHDLLPLPLTEETLNHVAARVGRVQDALGRRIALENASTYVTFTSDTMDEWDFLAELTRRADCDLLLDINNVYVSAFNHGFDAADYLAGIPKDRVRQIHLAGHEHNGDHIVDTHDAPVAEPVWDLYRAAVARFGAVPTMIERDANIPPFADLVEELGAARRLAAEALGEAAA